MNHRRLIAIVGGIGSGKSVVSQVLRCMGYSVYDTDSHARTLMHQDEVRHAVEGRFGNVYASDGRLQRDKLARIVFADPAALQDLNAIVHPAICRDVAQWAQGRAVSFVETALLEQSGLRQVVDEVWRVQAPQDLRETRIMRRSGLNIREVRQRIAAQRVEDVVVPTDKLIVNDGVMPILPQVINLLGDGHFFQPKT